MRAVESFVALTTIYFLLPLHNASMGVVATIFTIGLVILTGLLIFQVRSVMSSPVRSRPATVAHHLTDDRRASTVRGQARHVAVACAVVCQVRVDSSVPPDG